MEDFKKVKIAVCILDLGIESGRNELSIVTRSKENKTLSIYATIKNFKELFENPSKFMFDLQDYSDEDEPMFDEKLEEILLNKKLVTEIILTYDNQFVYNVLNINSFNRALD